MKCTKCGRENPASTLYCVGCGNQLDLSPERLQESLSKEISTERAQGLESTLRSIVAGALVLAIVVGFLKHRTDSMPDPDLLPIIKMPPLPLSSSPMIEFEEEGLRPMPSLDVPPYIRPEPHMVKKGVIELRKKVYAINNVILYLKNPPNSKVQGRLLGKSEDEKYFYIIDSFTNQENRVDADNVKEVKRADAPE